ncbi:Obg-like ATPase [Cichlidogyrus casuarinus]|uniref:Obg-like ATPase 1 n=1 Tax=Cichlidogyrus casuarinus TaxID=1844966 RepID=A0ABD2PZT9_9PLAT
MPPKKAEETKKPLLGRVGTSLKMGIVGLPNVGKSTFFNCLCSQSIAAENYPFCTIDPNLGKVPVPDDRYDFLCETFKPASKVPAYLNVVDIAGLVKGASEGTGLGNAFLSHIKEVDGIFHMLRAFKDEDIVHVEGEVDPIRDLEIISEELRLKDVEYLSKQLDSKGALVRANRSGDRAKIFEFQTLNKVKAVLEEDRKPVRFADWTSNEIEVLNQHLFITAKPIIYLVNVSKANYLEKKNKWLGKILEWVKTNDPDGQKGIIPFSAEFEQEWLNLSQEDRNKFQEEHGGTGSALPKIIKLGFTQLNLEYFFTCGEDEVRAWVIYKGMKAPKAAGRIHTDFENGFIMAEVMAYADFHEHKSELKVKEAGKYLQKGRDYIVNDGDIIFFKANTGAGLNSKKK